jgi:hypothetical protein
MLPPRGKYSGAIPHSRGVNFDRIAAPLIEPGAPLIRVVVIPRQNMHFSIARPVSRGAI